ncbi:hypothetical protein N9F08_01375 [bacterium]|nr:hypothetical protein [bacterium]
MKTTLFTSALLLAFASFSQNKNVGINTNTPDPSAVLHLESNNQGLLVPRLTTLERDAIAAPAVGLIIYHTDVLQEEIWNGTCWVPTYLEHCDDCEVDIAFQQATYNIDRMATMSISAPVTITQSTPGGTVLPVELTVVHTFTEETDVTLSQYSVTGTSTINIDILTNVFERGGDHFVTIFANCGERIVAKTLTINVALCDLVNITTDQTNYDLSANGITGNSCVVVTIEENVSIRSDDATIPAFTTGAINPACKMGIIHRGLIFGKGGNASIQMTVNGQNGGDALVLGCDTEIRNTGMLYAGGGAGLTVGIFQPVNLGPFTICLAVGAGGGGGMPDGLGGGDTQGICNIILGLWESGNDAESLYDDDEGAPVSKGIVQPFSFGPIQGVFAVKANGGGGGDFGEAGATIAVPVDFTGTSLEICINLPFIGDICAPIPGLSAALNGISNQIYNALLSVSPGQPGFAIKRTGVVNIEDGDYQTVSIRGQIGI